MGTDQRARKSFFTNIFNMKKPQTLTGHSHQAPAEEKKTEAKVLELKPAMPVYKKLENGNYEVSAAELEGMHARLHDYEKDIRVLHDSSLKTMDLLGLVDHNTGKVKEEVLDGRENPFPSILKGGSSLLSLVGQSSMGMGSAKRKLEEKFEFLQALIPLLQKYGK